MLSKFILFSQIVFSCIFCADIGQKKVSILDEYISRDDGHFKWHVESEMSFKTLTGNQAHVLNVTSQKWLDESKWKGQNGALW